MATVIQIKRSTGLSAPTTSDLSEGELAYTQDRSNSGASAKLWIESVDSDNSTPLIEAIGGKYYTDNNDYSIKKAVEKIPAKPALRPGNIEVLPLRAAREKAHIRKDRLLRLEAR